METTIRQFGENWPESVFADLHRCVQAFVTPPTIEIIREGFPFNKYHVHRRNFDNNEWLCITGQLSIRNIRHRYNVPIVIWISHKFPTDAPIVTLLDSTDIAIMPDHSNVDKRGLIFLPYLNSWNASNTLLDMLVMTVNVFEGNLPIQRKPITCQQPAAVKQHSVIVNEEQVRQNQFVKCAIKSLAHELGDALWDNTAPLTAENEQTIDWIDIYADADSVIKDMKVRNFSNYRIAEAVALGIAIDSHLNRLHDKFVLTHFTNLSTYIAIIRAMGRRQTFAFIHAK